MFKKMIDDKDDNYEDGYENIRWDKEKKKSKLSNETLKNTNTVFSNDLRITIRNDRYRLEEKASRPIALPISPSLSTKNSSFCDELKKDKSDIPIPTKTDYSSFFNDREYFISLLYPTSTITIPSEPTLIQNPTIVVPPLTYSCTICQKTYSKAYNLQRHEKSHLKNNLENICENPGCYKSFLTTKSRRHHVKYVCPFRSQ